MTTVVSVLGAISAPIKIHPSRPAGLPPDLGALNCSRLLRLTLAGGDQFGFDFRRAGTTRLLAS